MSHTHATESDFGTGKKSLSIYVIGIALCIILTLIPFAVVMHGKLSHSVIYTVIFLSAILQFFVQVFCFLRLNVQTEQGKLNVMSFIFTLVVLAVIVGGSLWIMWSLGYHMSH